MHHLSNSRPLLCRELIGRERELQELQEAFQLATAGQPQLVLLASEAGLGKSKLCRTFMQASHAQQPLLLFGQAIPQDSALPFGPFLDAFHRHFSTAMKTLAHDPLPAPFTFLLRIFPELASLFSESISPSFESSIVVQSQQAVFHGILNALQILAHSSQRPLLLILEDLHWADETSLELLAFLAQRFEVNTSPTEVSTPLLIVGTYRNEALPDSPSLRRLLMQLQAQRHLREVQLAPLSFTEQWHCVNTILEQTMPEPFARFLFDWDEGNPFFTEELLGAMAASGQLQLVAESWLVSAEMKPHLPSSLAASILERFTQLPAPDQEVLSYAAVIGRTFAFPLLSALCDRDEAELIWVLRRAIKLQLISEVSNTQFANMVPNEEEHYQFRHALTREAIYDSMLASERRLRHRTVAETLEQLTKADQDGPVSAEGSTRSSGNAALPIRADRVHQLLAQHYWLAGLPEKARPHALYEAEHARSIFAFREERYYLNMAQSSLLEDSLERLALLQRMGMVSIAIFDFSNALHWLGIAKAGYQHIGESYQTLQTMANMLLPAWFVASSSLPDMLAELEVATEAVFADTHPANRDSKTLVITSLIATYRAYDCEFQRAMYWIKRSFELYESLTEPRKVAAIQLSLMSFGWIKAHSRASVAEEGIAELRNVLKTGLQYNLPDVIVFSYAWLSFTLVLWGRGDEAEQVLAESLDFEQISGLPHPSFAEGWKYFFAGEDWEQGIKLLQSDIKLRKQANTPALVAIEALALLQMLLAKNELNKAELYLQQIQPVLEFQDQYIYLSQMWWGLAKLSIARGDLSQPQALYERILNRWETTEDSLIILPILLDSILFYIDTGNLAKAQQWLTELQSVMQVTDNPVGTAALLQTQGALKAAEGKMKEAIPLLREAVEAWGTIHWHYHQALACQRLAEVLLGWASKASINRSTRQAAREEAEMLLEKALAVYERLQIPTGIKAIHSLRTQTRLEAQQKRRSTLEAHQPVQGLTEREAQVLLHLAAGRTNREIATALNLSIGTVELHVSHILSKLGCETRTQAAAYAIAQGWINHQPPP